MSHYGYRSLSLVIVLSCASLHADDPKPQERDKWNLQADPSLKALSESTETSSNANANETHTLADFAREELRGQEEAEKRDPWLEAVLQNGKAEKAKEEAKKNKKTSGVDTDANANETDPWLQAVLNTEIAKEEASKGTKSSLDTNGKHDYLMKKLKELGPLALFGLAGFVFVFYLVVPWVQKIRRDSASIRNDKENPKQRKHRETEYRRGFVKLNRRQRVVLCVGLAVAAGMGLFPPWESRVSFARAVYDAEGYHFIAFKGSIKGLIPDKEWGWRIDTTTLWVQWISVAFATAAAVIILGDWSAHGKKRSSTRNA